MTVKKCLLACIAATATFLCGSASAGPMLFDVDNTFTNQGATEVTQTGWTGVNLSNIAGVTFSGVGGVGIESRDRGTQNTDGAGGDTVNNDMWRDFIFAYNPTGSVNESGLDIMISGLLASTNYSVRLWAFDEGSNGGRNMTWNGNALNIPTNGDPNSLDDQVVTFVTASDAAGTLTLEGRIGSPQGTCCNVFVNGFELTAAAEVPVPATLVLFGLGLVGLGWTKRRTV